MYMIFLISLDREFKIAYLRGNMLRIPTLQVCGEYLSINGVCWGFMAGCSAAGSAYGWGP